MPADENNINSVVDAISIIHSLRLRASRGENVDMEMSRALFAIQQSSCVGADDAIALLNISRMILDHIIWRNEGSPDNPDAVLAAHAWTYLDRAITHLETLLRQAELQNGATIN